MLEQALAKLEAMAQAEMQIQVVHPQMEPGHIYYLVDSGGELTRVEADPAPRAHVASDLTSLVAFAVDYNKDAILDSQGDEISPEQHTEVWYSRKGVTCFLDGTLRRDRVTLPLEYSRQLLALSCEPKPLSQKEFLNFLRVALFGCVPAPLISTVRHLKFRQVATGEAELRQGKASIGKTLEAELRGCADFPEEITLTVPVFHGFMAYRLYPIGCNLDVDAQTERFTLTPFPGQIELAIRAAEDQLGADLRSSLCAALGLDDEPLQIPVLYGTP